MIPLWLHPILFLTGLAAGFVDSIAGGGGVITIPVLLNLGLSPQDALGTNKLQATFGSGSAAWHYGRAGYIAYQECVTGIVFTFAGAVAGTWMVQQLNPAFLRHAIPWLLTAIAIYMLCQPALGEKDIHPRLGPGLFHGCFGLLIGFYDGFFGPGTGTFWAMAYMLGLGFNMTKATAHTKLMNFTSNCASLLGFLAGGQVYYSAGLTMGIGQLVGAQIGARVVIRRGTKFIRPVFITIALLLTVKLLWENYARPGR